MKKLISITSYSRRSSSTQRIGLEYANQQLRQVTDQWFETNKENIYDQFLQVCSSPEEVDKKVQAFKWKAQLALFDQFKQNLNAPKI